MITWTYDILLNQTGEHKTGTVKAGSLRKARAAAWREAGMPSSCTFCSIMKVVK